MARQPEGGPWWDLLREAVAEYSLETEETELPIGHFIEWLVEWGREVRRRQTGLMLLTAHRAKGLEFDHVAVLDGGWERVGQNEDADAGPPALLCGHDPGQKDPYPGPSRTVPSPAGFIARRPLYPASTAR